MSGRSLVQRSPTECGVSECDSEASTRGPWQTGGEWEGGSSAMVKKNNSELFCSERQSIKSNISHKRRVSLDNF